MPSVGPGGNFTVTVGNCEPGERVVINFQGEARITICNPSTLQASLALVAPTTPGTYRVCGELTGIGASLPPGVIRPQTVCTSVEVIDSGPVPPTTTPAGGVPAPGTTVPGAAVPPSTVAGGGLAATGSSGLDTTTTSAAVLLGAGFLLLVVAQMRRRRSTATA